MSTYGTSFPKKVAFVAMPFGIKKTGLDGQLGPAIVDFDGLWDQAISAALEALGYQPVRADNQTGSVIVQDMLEQLVYADLVLADISIPNGNVYYEAGIRHAVRPQGCVLIGADWAQPLFDVKQFRQIRYPFGKDKPRNRTYQEVHDHLVEGIPPLVDSQGPVHALTGVEQGNVHSGRLREASAAASDFQMTLRAARVQAEGGDKSAVRDLIANDVSCLPGYAFKELLILVRDALEWRDVLDLAERAPEALRKDVFVREQTALAKGNTGQWAAAIAELTQLNAELGKTPERLGIIGGRYKRLFDAETDPVKRNKWLNAAICAYQEGMDLDLNEYYCSSNLPRLYRQRQSGDDLERASAVAVQVVAACERARRLGLGDEWLNPTLLVHAFKAGELNKATLLVDEITQSAKPARWQLESCIADLGASLEFITNESMRPDFESLLDRLLRLISVSQVELVSKILPEIISNGECYVKHGKVQARQAEAGEEVVSVTSDGRETSNVAEAGDYLVRNATETQECYLVSGDTFNKRYARLSNLDDNWALYHAIGEVRAIEIDDAILAHVNKSKTFYILAPWGSPQRVNPGDYFVSTLPDLKEVYRIGRREFGQTYQLKS